MGCNCGGPKKENQSDGQYEVRLPNGEVRVLASEHEAKVAITIAGGGTYSRR